MKERKEKKIHHEKEGRAKRKKQSRINETQLQNNKQRRN